MIKTPPFSRLKNQNQSYSWPKSRKQMQIWLNNSSSSISKSKVCRIRIYRGRVPTIHNLLTEFKIIQLVCSNSRSERTKWWRIRGREVWLAQWFQIRFSKMMLKITSCRTMQHKRNASISDKCRNKKSKIIKGKTGNFKVKCRVVICEQSRQRTS